MKPQRLTQLLSVVVLLTAACGGTATSSSSSSPGLHRFAGQTLTVGIFFGDFGDKLAQGAGPAFEAATGAKLQWSVAASNANISKLIASQGASPPFDAIITDYSTIAPAISAGLMAKPDYSTMPNVKSAYPGSNGAWGPFLWYYVPAMCYRTDKYSENGIAPPTGIDSVFDPKVQGHINWPASDIGLNFFVEPIAENYGLPLDNPTPFINKFSSIKAASYSSTELDMAAALQSGGAWLAPDGDWPDCINLKNKGVPIGIAPYNLNIKGKAYPYFAAPVGIEFAKGGNLALAEAFANFLLDPTGNGIIYAMKAYQQGATAIPGANQQLLADPAIAKNMFTDPGALYTTWDPFVFAAHQTDWVNAWNRAFK